VAADRNWTTGTIGTSATVGEAAGAAEGAVAGETFGVTEGTVGATEAGDESVRGAGEPGTPPAMAASTGDPATDGDGAVVPGWPTPDVTA
jgi:hypothetical protein